MQYYQFHLGDYISHTAHLEPLEDLAYRRLLDLYYSTEQPIPNDIQSVSRRLRLGSDVVEIVLNEFFDLSDGVWHNHRCDVEISKFNEWINKQKANGRKGGRPRKQPQNKPRKTHGKPIANPSPTDRKPIVKPPTTHNPLPITHNPTKPNLTRWNLKPLAAALQKRYNIGCPDMVGFSAAIDQAVADGFDSESVQIVLDWLGKRESFDKFFPSFKRPDLLREKLCDIAAKRQERIAELDALGD